ncbi:MAG: transposase [Legionella sp.]|nr:transposase [Legionella sp.]
MIQLPTEGIINMVNYRRDFTAGATYFFTLTLQNRDSNYLTQYIDLLGEAFRHVRKKAHFTTHAIAVLPEHLHVVWELPRDDCSYSLRWRLIKTRFTQEINKKNFMSKNNRGEFDLWQKRFWEHRIRDENDLQKHIDYIHYNPVKHGHVVAPVDWPHSSIHRYIKEGILQVDWGGEN